MFETIEFRRGIESHLYDAVVRHKLLRYDPAIPDTLQFLAIANEDAEPPFYRPRGLEDAYKSVTLLGDTAAEIAREQNSLEMRLVDFAFAYRRQFCKIWPFCR